MGNLSTVSGILFSLLGLLWLISIGLIINAVSYKTKKEFEDDDTTNSLCILKRYAALYERNMITKEEFNQKKDELFSSKVILSNTYKKNLFEVKYDEEDDYF